MSAKTRLIYESFARYLVEHKGYDKDLLNLTPATWDFCFKGLVVDLEDGNLVKLAEDGTVLRATHGTNDLSTEEIIKHYGPKREWKHFNSLNTSFTRSAKYYFYDNYFDLPGALLCGRVVDMLHKRGNEVNSDFWKDMVAAIDHNYNTSAFKEDAGTYFPSVKREPGRYLQPCSDSVKAWLRSMKKPQHVSPPKESSQSPSCVSVCVFRIMFKPLLYKRKPSLAFSRCSVVSRLEASDSQLSIFEPIDAAVAQRQTGPSPMKVVVRSLLLQLSKHCLSHSGQVPITEVNVVYLALYRKDFEELFDVIITNALKPGFFSLVPQQRPFRTLVNDVEDSEGLPSLDKPGWYSQGNWPHLHELLKTMTGKPDPKVGQPPQAERDAGFTINQLREIHTGVMERRNVAPGIDCRHGCCVPACWEFTDKTGQTVQPAPLILEQGMKAPSAVSKQWGSYFVDVHRSGGGDEESQKLTWCCHCIHKYSTMAIPSVEHIADLPLDYKFPRFSPDKPCTTGYYPRPPDSLLKRCESLS
ncbi:5'-nucleotidase domain-containing protein 1 [Morone saxatilis]|uniref:5'-nucleotidase domain-containing protein 1 n=1 Tax=Morone saxatilis TaxID=34816 RepID=UPI0015E1EBB9|nr:5'-nucleotidase domain-containing protein 1 [Morone saxatilis]